MWLIGGLRAREALCSPAVTCPGAMSRARWRLCGPTKSAQILKRSAHIQGESEQTGEAAIREREKPHKILDVNDVLLFWAGIGEDGKMDLLRAACLPPLSLIANVVPFCLDVIRAR